MHVRGFNYECAEDIDENVISRKRRADITRKRTYIAFEQEAKNMNKPAKTVYRHYRFTRGTAFTYDHKEFFVELNNANVCHGYNTFEAAMEALNYQT